MNNNNTTLTPVIKKSNTFTHLIHAGIIFFAGTFFNSAIAVCDTYQVECYMWNTATQKWDCNCQYFWCSTGYTEGACPVPSTSTLDSTSNKPLNSLTGLNSIQFSQKGMILTFKNGETKLLKSTNGSAPSVILLDGNVNIPVKMDGTLIGPGTDQSSTPQRPFGVPPKKP